MTVQLPGSAFSRETRSGNRAAGGGGGGGGGGGKGCYWKSQRDPPPWKIRGGGLEGAVLELNPREH